MYATIGVSRIAGWCWIGAPPRGQPQTPAMMLLHGGEGLCVRRMAMLWTFRRPFMGRPVPRQLLRNVLLDVTTLMLATAYNRISYKWVGSERVASRYVSPIPPLDPYVRLSPHTAHEHRAFYVSLPFHPLHGVSPCQARITLARSHNLYPWGLRLQSSSWCPWLSHAPTPRPHLTVWGALGFSLGFRAFLLSTPLHSPCRLSRVQPMTLTQDGVGGAFSHQSHGHSLWLPSVCTG